MIILVVNAGSSSLKYQLIDMSDESVIAKGNCDRIGIDGHISHKTADGRKIDEDCSFPTHTEAFMKLVECLTKGDAKVIDSMDAISAVGHRIVQGADIFDKSVLVTDEVIDGMITGSKDIAVVYSGDATTILAENEDMSFWMPTEGTNLWSDAMVIPANAENPLLAHEFINYVLTYEASLDNSEYVGYASSNQEVLDELSSEDGLFADNEAYLPRSGYEKDEVFEDNAVLKKMLAELWIKVKAAK